MLLYKSEKGTSPGTYSPRSTLSSTLQWADSAFVRTKRQVFFVPGSTPPDRASPALRELHPFGGVSLCSVHTRHVAALLQGQVVNTQVLRLISRVIQTHRGEVGYPQRSGSCLGLGTVLLKLWSVATGHQPHLGAC